MYAIRSYYALSTGNGSIVLSIPGSTSAEVTATSALGTVRVSDLEIGGAVQSPGSLIGILGTGSRNNFV